MPGSVVMHLSIWAGNESLVRWDRTAFGGSGLQGHGPAVQSGATEAAEGDLYKPVGGWPCEAFAGSAGEAQQATW